MCGMRKKVLVALRMAGAAGQGKLAGVFRYLRERHGDTQHWDMRLVRTHYDFTKEAVEKAIADGCDGFIVSIPDTNGAVQPIAATSIPAIVMDMRDDALEARKSNIVFIRNSAEKIARAAADFLVGQGMARTYAFLHPSRATEWSLARFDAFRRILADAGLWCEELSRVQDAVKLRRPAAVFAANDDRAFELVKFLHDRKVSVPRDISILGVDNDTLICENSHPRLSSVEPDFENEGFMAAEALDGMMRSRCPRPRTLLADVKSVVKRESTAELSYAGRLVQKAAAYIDQHAAEGIGVGDVVRHLKCSRRLADLRFRELQGRTILQAITERRLDEVRRLLVSTREKIDNIAAACGYESPNYLKNLFKKRFGCSMRDYRNLSSNGLECLSV